MPALPVLSWIGALPSTSIRARLAPHVDVVEGYRPDAAVIVVWAIGGPDALRALPATGKRAAVIATHPSEPSMRERLEWIRAGAEDLVGIDKMITTVHEAFPIPSSLVPDLPTPPRLAARPTTPVTRPPQAPTRPAPAPAAAAVAAAVAGVAVEATPAPARNDGPPPRAPAAAPAPNPAAALPLAVDAPTPLPARDPYSPILVPIGPEGISDAQRAWAHHAQRYISRRTSFLSTLGPGAVDAFLALAHMREHLDVMVNNATASTRFGQKSPTGGTLNWPAVVRKIAADEDPSAGEAAQIVAAGTDGMVIAIGFTVGPRTRLVLDVPYSAGANGQVLAEARWQRPVDVGRWEVGLVMLEMRLVAL